MTLSAKSRAFHSRRYGVWGSTAGAAIFGLLSPVMFMAITILLGGIPASGFARTWLVFGFFVVLLGFLVAFAYRRVRGGQFRHTKAVAWQTGFLVALFAGALAGSAWCCRHHVCIGGHMGHPPYASMHYWIDGFWTGGMAVTVIVLAAIRLRACIALAAVTGFILSYRFVFGSFGGILPFPL